MNPPDELQLFMDECATIMEQAREFAPDPPTGRQINQTALGPVLADEAISRSKEHNQLFVSAAFTAICARAAQPGPFTSDDIWPMLFDDPYAEPRAMGAAFREASKLGFIRATGKFVKSKRAACHGRDIREWEGVYQIVTALPAVGTAGESDEART